MRTLLILAAALAAAAGATTANAVTCYTLLDGSDRLLYQDASPPVDMSDKGAALREGLRRRNEYLVIASVDTCRPVAAVAGSSGYRPATVDEIVGEMRGYLTYGGVSSAPGIAVGASAGGGSVGSAPAPAASSGSSSGTRSSY
jgi:hypothetical protein